MPAARCSSLSVAMSGWAAARARVAGYTVTAVAIQRARAAAQPPSAEAT